MPTAGEHQALRVHNLTMSLDGYIAGPDQTLENPMGRGGNLLHPWAFASRTFRSRHGMEGGEEGVDDRFQAAALENVGASIIGRNMFGPVRGPWGGEEWRGWWGEDPPFHHPVFVLTHHARPSLEIEGGTTFHFVTDGIEAALRRAKEAADGRDVGLGGGAQTLRQFMDVGLVDEAHIAVVPALLGAGERLFEGWDAPEAGYVCTECVQGERATHMRITRAA
jgi:dihydrofolate reductase